MSEIATYDKTEPPLMQTIKDADFMAERMASRDTEPGLIVKSVRRGVVTYRDGTTDEYQEIKFRRRRS